MLFVIAMASISTGIIWIALFGNNTIFKKEPKGLTSEGVYNEFKHLEWEEKGYQITEFSPYYWNGFTFKLIKPDYNFYYIVKIQFNKFEYLVIVSTLIDNIEVEKQEFTDYYGNLAVGGMFNRIIEDAEIKIEHKIDFHRKVKKAN